MGGLMRRNRQRRMLILGRRGEDAYESYVNSLAPVGWWKLDETSGTVAANSGTGGAALNGTQEACTINTDGIIDRAYTWNGTAPNGSVVTVPNDASINALTTQRWAFLVRLDSLGVSSAGRLLAWGTSTLLTCVSNNRLQAIVYASDTNAAATTATGQISDLIGNYAWIFVDYDDATTKRLRIFKALGGVVTQLTLATDTAAVGTVNTQLSPLAIGNRTVRDFTLDGAIDEVIFSDGLWSLSEMQTLAQYTIAEPFLSGTVYVSKAGGDGNIGTVDSPVLTIARANAIASSTAISRVVVGAGTYQEEVIPPHSGITYSANGVVVIDGQTTRDGFDVSVANITIDGFTFVNCTQGVYFKAGADGGRALNCASSATTARGFYANAATGIRFENCYSHDHTTGYGFEFEAGANNGLCLNCWSTTGTHGFICKTSSDVTFRNCAAWGTDLATFYSKAGDGMRVENCVAYDTQYGIYLANDSGSPPNSSNAVIRNTIIEATLYGIYAPLPADIAGLDSDYNDFYDNTHSGSAINNLHAGKLEAGRPGCQQP